MPSKLTRAQDRLRERGPTPDTSRGPRPMSQAEREQRLYEGRMPTGQNGVTIGLDRKGRLL